MKYIASKKRLGIFWMLLHCTNLSIMSIMVRICSEEGLPIIEIFFISTLISFFCMVIWAIYTKGKELHINKPVLYILRAVLSIVGMSLWFYVLKVIPLTEATALNYTTPLFAVIAAILFLSERAGWYRILGIIVGFIGVLIIIRQGIEIVKLGSLLGILAAALWAIVDIITKIQTNTEKLATQTFYITLLMALLTLPMMIPVWQLPSMGQWLSLGILGMVFLLNFFAIFKAYQLADLTLLLPFDFSRLLLTVVFAYLLFGEIIDIWSGIGAIVILSSAVYIVYHEAQIN